VRLGMKMRSCFLKKICALTASSKYTAGWARNPAGARQVVGQFE
jgi:hypothetical protein